MMINEEDNDDSIEMGGFLKAELVINSKTERKGGPKMEPEAELGATHSAIFTLAFAR